MVIKEGNDKEESDGCKESRVNSLRRHSTWWWWWGRWPIKLEKVVKYNSCKKKR
jgi:hypothetical protein